MQETKSLPYSFDCISSGVDWITASCAPGASRRAFEAVGEELLSKGTAAGVEIQPAAVRDYVGWRAPGIFAGRRRADSLIRLSAANALAHWQTVAQHATNVSRLDLQVTVWTHGEQPALSRWYYQRVRRLPPSRGRPRSFSLIQTHPHGDTLYVGKRQSDCFGRVYDYAAAHSQGEPRTLWRYEVEYKRHLAVNHCRALRASNDHGMATESIVANWYSTRGIQQTWKSSESPHSEDVSISERERDVLSWFDTSLSKTVAGAIRRHGLRAVLDALHLSQLVIPYPRKGESAYANLAPQALRLDNRRGATRATDDDTVLVQGGR
jgi:hypothetical protein